MTKNAKLFWKVIFSVLGLVAVITLALLLANNIQNNPELQKTVVEWGYVGVVIWGVIAGLNVVIPLPAGSFAPVFAAGGLWMPFIIIALALGTLIADYIGYAFGRWSRAGIGEKYPKLLTYYEKLVTNHHFWILPSIFLWAAFAPFPNEAIILPLAVLGIRFRFMFIPLLLGGIVHQALFSYGAQNLFLWWF